MDHHGFYKNLRTFHGPSWILQEFKDFSWIKDFSWTIMDFYKNLRTFHGPSWILQEFKDF